MHSIFSKILKILSSFSLKIYAVLLLVGVTPLIASYFLIQRIFTFNVELQEEAIHTLDDASAYYRAWAQSEASKVRLLRAMTEKRAQEVLLNVSNELRHIPSQSSPNPELDNVFYQAFEQQFNELLSPLLVQQKSLLQVECMADNRVIASVGQVPSSPESLRLKFETLELNWEQLPAYHAKLYWDDSVCGAANTNCNASLVYIEILKGNVALWKSEQYRDIANLRPQELQLPLTAVLPLDAVPLALQLVYGVDRSLSDKYELLGEKRFLHQGLAQIEADEDNSLSGSYRSFYLLMSALVLFLTVIAALFIAFPLGRRVSILSKATEKVAAGDLSVKIKASGHDELGQLMQQFNLMVEDVKAAQESRAYVERMQAWQEVARRLAHEIKNPLTPLLLVMQQLDRKFDDYMDKPERYRRLVNDVVEIVNEEAATLQKLVREFSEFARLPSPEPKNTAIIPFIEQLFQLNPQFGEEAEIRLQGSDEHRELLLRLDHELMRRVFINVIRNSIEACKNASIKPQIDFSFIHDQQKQLFIARLRDNGPGLTQEQKERLFTPYFTTKSDGTGLGLSIVRKICQDHGGDFLLHNRTDNVSGAEAEIILPL
ncbi:MAG: ATP-binding protein [Bradymonadales bacterium]|jgi:nitrogen fixation/metabolism regulation signal transduction histidine kinase